MKTLWSDRKYHYLDERQKNRKLKKNKKKILVYLILMKADATDKNKCPLGRKKRFKSQTQIESKRT